MQITLVITLSILFIITLFIIEGRLNKKLQVQEKDRNAIFLKRIEDLKKLDKNPKRKLSALDKISKSFFQAAFELGEQLSYSELIQEFKEKGNKNCANFCENILKLNYSQRLFDQKEVDLLIKDFEKIIGENKIFAEQKEESAEMAPEAEWAKKELSEKDWKKLKKNLHHHKNKIENLIYQIFSDKELIDLAYLPTKDSKELSEKNPEKYKKGMEIFAKKAVIYSEIKKFIKQLYYKIQIEDKPDLDKLIKNWEKELENKAINEKNPFNQQINTLALLKKLIVELEKNC